MLSRLSLAGESWHLWSETSGLSLIAIGPLFDSHLSQINLFLSRTVSIHPLVLTQMGVNVLSGEEEDKENGIY